MSAVTTEYLDTLTSRINHAAVILRELESLCEKLDALLVEEVDSRTVEDIMDVRMNLVVDCDYVRMEISALQKQIILLRSDKDRF